MKLHYKTFTDRREIQFYPRAQEELFTAALKGILSGLTKDVQGYMGYHQLQLSDVEHESQAHQVTGGRILLEPHKIRFQFIEPHSTYHQPLESRALFENGKTHLKKQIEQKSEETYLEEAGLKNIPLLYQVNDRSVEVNFETETQYQLLLQKVFGSHDITPFFEHHGPTAVWSDSYRRAYLENRTLSFVINHSMETELLEAILKPDLKDIFERLQKKGYEIHPAHTKYDFKN